MVLGEIIGWEFLLILAIAALLFGGSQIPKLARSLGQASHEFHKGVSEGSQEKNDAKAEVKADEKADDKSEEDVP
ncbi:MAG TPA: twin-arginine translocase TatA/TatE family subunit [Acidimicrobiia bacterium]|jgi:sec-independent protein translocase protein TatA